MVNGAKQPYLRNSAHEASRATKYLTAVCGFPVSVEGLIGPVGAAELVIKKRSHRARVVTSKEVAGWLLRHGTVHSEAEVTAIYEAARRSSTWQH